MINKSKFFKFSILNLLLTIMFSLNSYAQIEAVQTSFSISGNEVTVYMKSNQDITAQQFTQFSVDFKYANANFPVFSISSYNAALMNSAPYLISIPGSDPNYPNYSIQRLGFAGGTKSVSLTSGTEYEVFRFIITGGLGFGSIGLVYDMTNYSYNPQISFVTDYTNWTEPFYGLSLNNSDYTINAEDWMWRTLDMYFGKYWKTNAASTAWATTSNWSDNLVPTVTDNITILSGANQPIAGAASVCNKLQIVTGATLDVAYNGDLTIDGDLTIADNNSLIVRSTEFGTGSLITNGAVPAGDKVKVERYITKYTSNTNGWRLISSPIGSVAAGTFAPGGSDDFFRYNESTNIWENYAQSSFGFTIGKGILAAYSVSGAKSFSGSLHNGSVSFSNLSLGVGDGWHVLGNPFASAIEWNDGNWNLNNVNATAKILNAGATYDDLDANEIIPAMTGFVVKVTNATNGLLIPVDARTHSSVNTLNKSAISEKLVVKIQSLGNNTYVKSTIKTNDNATNAFDAAFDADFLAGLSGAPQLYSIVNNKALSTNAISTIGNNVVSVPMGFVAGTANTYQLTADGINTFNCSAITLEDTKTNTFHNLMSNNTYNFTATASDNVNRFIVHFNSAVGINNNNQVNNSTIYSNGSEIYVSSTESIKQISIYNTVGQLIYTANNPQGLFTYNLKDNSTGYYIVKVITDKNVNSEKVFVK